MDKMLSERCYLLLNYLFIENHFHKKHYSTFTSVDEFCYLGGRHVKVLAVLCGWISCTCTVLWQQISSHFHVAIPWTTKCKKSYNVQYQDTETTSGFRRLFMPLVRNVTHHRGCIADRNSPNLKSETISVE